MPDQPHSTELLDPTGIPQPRHYPAKGEPLIHQVNWVGLKTLYMKEVRRFFKVQTQTIWAPAITTMLFLVIFSVALGRGGRESARIRAGAHLVQQRGGRRWIGAVRAI
jgi:ABC-2 type transport system permease protein